MYYKDKRTHQGYKDYNKDTNLNSKIISKIDT